MAIPKALQTKYDEIAPYITKFCSEKLSAEYNDICLRLLEKLCRKRPSPLLSGKARTWAAGIVYSIAQNNFIFDKSQSLNMTAAELAAPFGISASTASSKAAEIRQYVEISYFTNEWMLAELAEKNPMNWLIEVDGFIVDVRDIPITMQRAAVEQEAIPFMPERKRLAKDGKIKSQISLQPHTPIKPGQMFEFLFTIPMDEYELWRKVSVPAGITFKQLHFVLQRCFNWLSYHMYDFKIFDNDKEGTLIAVISDDDEQADFLDADIALYPENTPISVFLPKYTHIMYTYDYGDDWVHYCELMRVLENTHNYPICTDGKGDAPPDDVGGEDGYIEFLAAISDKAHPEHAEMKVWGKSQKFEKFNIDKVNKKLEKSLTRTW